MAAGPICIYYPSGMVCDTTSYEYHYHALRPNEQEPNPQPGCRRVEDSREDLEAKRRILEALGRAGIMEREADVYVKVIMLMQKAHITDQTPFTIMYPRDWRWEPQRQK